MIYMRTIKTDEMLRQLVRKMAPPLGKYILYVILRWDRYYYVLQRN